MTDKTQYTVAQSPFITWPVTFWMPQEDGPETEVSWPFRFLRPMAADTKRYKDERKRRAEREAEDLRERIAVPLRSVTGKEREQMLAQVDPDLRASLERPAPEPITDEAREQRLLQIHDPAAWRAKFWRGWRTQTLKDTDGRLLDPDSEDDRAYILQIAGLEQAIDSAIEQMMLGGRQKNLRPPLGP